MDQESHNRGETTMWTGQSACEQTWSKQHLWLLFWVVHNFHTTSHFPTSIATDLERNLNWRKQQKYIQATHQQSHSQVQLFDIVAPRVKYRQKQMIWIYLYMYSLS